MPRWFNTAGPCESRDHYMLPPLRRLPDVRRVVDQAGYFVVHAPRQVGKTTGLVALARALTAEGRYAAVLVSMLLGAARPVRTPEDRAELVAAMLGSWRRTAELHLPPELHPPPWPEAPPDERIGASLAAWARACPRPLVVFLDEFDALRDDVLLSAVRQLQDGYRDRPERFPWSVALVGLRDVRDYRIETDGFGDHGTPSPFNVIVRSFTVRDFSADEVAELYEQHTAETGQRFEPGAVARAFERSRGQPWIVNALAKIAVEEVVTDRSAPIAAADVDRAETILVGRRNVHFDSLAARLLDPRIRSVVEPMLEGADLESVPADDLRAAMISGLVSMTPDAGADLANPIYREMVARELPLVVRGGSPRLWA